jgi:hypothetical protein
MDVKAKIHDSYFDFVFRAMTNEQGLLDLDILSPLPIFFLNLNFLNEFFSPTSLPLSDFTLKST